MRGHEGAHLRLIARSGSATRAVSPVTRTGELAMLDQNYWDMALCADLLEAVADQLGDANDPLSQAETFDSVLHQSKELLTDVMGRLKEAVRLGEVRLTDGNASLALLDDVWRALADGVLTRPDELGLLYLRTAKVFRALGPPVPVGVAPSHQRERAKKDGA